MEIKKYDRKPFSVMAVKVDFKNIDEIATWCKGAIIEQKTKMMGVETSVPAIRIDGQGDNRGKFFIASLGCYVVELKGSFRVYKPAQFDSSFDEVEDEVFVEHLIEDPHVEKFFEAKDELEQTA